MRTFTAGGKWGAASKHDLLGQLLACRDIHRGIATNRLSAAGMNGITGRRLHSQWHEQDAQPWPLPGEAQGVRQGGSWDVAGRTGGRRWGSMF